MDQTSAQDLLTQAQTLHQAGDHTRALPLVLQVLDRYRNPTIWQLCGDIYLGLGQATEACEAYDRAVRGEPGNAAYHHDLARALLAAGRPAEAETALKSAATLNAQAWDVMCDLGTAQLEQG